MTLDPGVVVVVVVYQETFPLLKLVRVGCVDLKQQNHHSSANVQ